MKEVTIKLTPKSSFYPIIEEKTTDIRKVILAVFHDEYTVDITSRWYEDISQPLLINGAMDVRLQLKTLKGTVNVSGAGAFATINGIKKAIPATFTIPYTETTYEIKLEKEGYKTIVLQKPLEPDMPKIDITPSFVKIASTWKRVVVKTEVVPYGTQTVEDSSKLPNYRLVTRQGVMGERTFYIDNEHIDGVATGITRNASNAITKNPISEVVTVGVVQNGWSSKTRQEPIPFTSTSREDSTLLVTESYVEQTGRNGTRTYEWEERYVNGTTTGEKRLETNSITIEMVPEKKVVGTRIETWVATSKTEVIPFQYETREDSTLTESESYRFSEGANGTRLVSWEERFLNGVNTYEKRNETTVTTLPAINQVDIVGTKATRNRSRRIPFRIYSATR